MALIKRKLCIVIWGKGFQLDQRNVRCVRGLFIEIYSSLFMTHWGSNMLKSKSRLLNPSNELIKKLWFFFSLGKLILVNAAIRAWFAEFIGYHVPVLFLFNYFFRLLHFNSHSCIQLCHTLYLADVILIGNILVKEYLSNKAIWWRIWS